MRLDKIVKVVEIAATLVGMGATLASTWAEGKKMDQKIEEQVNKVLSERLDIKES